VVLGEGRGKYISVEGIAVKVPCIEYSSAFAERFGPFPTVGDGLEGREHGDDDNEEDECDLGCPTRCFEEAPPCSEEIPCLTKSKDCKVQGREVVMQKQLTFHQEEGQIMQCPSKNSDPYSPIITSPCGYSLVPVPEGERGKYDYYNLYIHVASEEY